jgi:hypothetical protein
VLIPQRDIPARYSLGPQALTEIIKSALFHLRTLTVGAVTLTVERNDVTHVVNGPVGYLGPLDQGVVRIKASDDIPAAPGAL